MDRINEHDERIIELERRIAELEVALSRLVSPMAAVFTVQLDGGTLWHERAIKNGSLQDATGGRLCDDAGHASAMIELAEDEAVFLEVPDINAHRYIRINGSGGGAESIGIYAFDVRMMVADGVAGWSQIRAVP